MGIKSWRSVWLAIHKSNVRLMSSSSYNKRLTFNAENRSTDILLLAFFSKLFRPIYSMAQVNLILNNFEKTTIDRYRSQYYLIIMQRILNLSSTAEVTNDAYIIYYWLVLDSQEKNNIKKYIWQPKLAVAQHGLLLANWFYYGQLEAGLINFYFNANELMIYR